MVRAALLPLAVLLTAAGPVKRPQTYLASISVALQPGGFVESFSIDTWGVTFMTVCHIPPGWRIKAGKSASPDGTLAGEASHGVAFLNRAGLDRLRNLVLLSLYPPVRQHETGSRDGEFMPATFTGHATVGTYGDDLHEHEVPITGANVRLTPATRCPAPHP